MNLLTEMPQFNFRKVIIDGLEIDAYFIDSLDEAFVISFFTPTDAQKKRL